MKVETLNGYADDLVRTARLACTDMSLACRRAASNFPHAWLQKAQAFEKAADDLARVYELLTPVEASLNADELARNIVVTTEMHSPYGRKVLPKWARAQNMSRGLRALAAEWPLHRDLLVQCAYELDAITFPTLADHDFPKQSPLKPGKTRVDGPRIIPARAT